MSYQEQDLQNNLEWFEIWFDKGLNPPYFLLLGKIKSKEKYVIHDIIKSYIIDSIHYTYIDAFNYLTEDEYSCVRGREVL